MGRERTSSFWSLVEASPGKEWRVLAQFTPFLMKVASKELWFLSYIGILYYSRNELGLSPEHTWLWVWPHPFWVDTFREPQARLTFKNLTYQDASEHKLPTVAGRMDVALMVIECVVGIVGQGTSPLDSASLERNCPKTVHHTWPSHMSRYLSSLWLQIL